MPRGSVRAHMHGDTAPSKGKLEDRQVMDSLPSGFGAERMMLWFFFTSSTC